MRIQGPWFGFVGHRGSIRVRILEGLVGWIDVKAISYTTSLKRLRVLKLIGCHATPARTVHIPLSIALFDVADSKQSTSTG